MKTYTGQDLPVSWVQELPSLCNWGVHMASWHVDMFTDPEALWISYLGSFMEVLSSKHDWLLTQSPVPLWRRQWQPTPVLLPGKSHRWRSLVGCSPWAREESDTTEQLHFHFSLSCIGEGNGNPFQCSCLENPKDSRAWWVAVYGVAHSRTRLKRLSSSSSQSLCLPWRM